MLHPRNICLIYRGKSKLTNQEIAFTISGININLMKTLGALFAGIKYIY